MLKANSYKLLFSFFLFTFSFLHSQTLEGTTGLFFIPTAEMQKDGQLSIGTNFVHRELISFGGFAEDAYTPYVTFTYLPFIEFNLRITRMIKSRVTTQGIGDRTFSVRIRFIEEGVVLPAFAFGLHDALAVFGGSGAIHNNALYIVGTKNISPHSFLIESISLHAGYGLDVIKADTHNFVGLFGGLSLHLLNHFELMTEYDGKRANCGLRIKYFDHLSLLGGFIGYKHFSGGASFNFTL